MQYNMPRRQAYRGFACQNPAGAPIRHKIVNFLPLPILRSLPTCSGPAVNTAISTPRPWSCISYHLRVHPLKIRGKTPILKGWQDKATTEAAPLQQWAQDYPHANAGIVAGAASGVIIVDMDARGGAHASLEKLRRQYGELPLSWEVLTPGGRHLYLRHPGGQVRTCRLAPGIEVLGDGANAVAPGSIHPGGDAYLWNPFLHPDVQPLADAPDWLLNFLKQKRVWTSRGRSAPAAVPSRIYWLRRRSCRRL